MLLAELALVNTPTASFLVIMELANATQRLALAAANVLLVLAPTAHLQFVELAVVARNKNQMVQELALMIIPAVLVNAMSQLVPKLAVIVMMFVQAVIAIVQLMPAVLLMPHIGEAAIVVPALQPAVIAVYAPLKGRNATLTITALIA